MIEYLVSVVHSEADSASILEVIHLHYCLLFTASWSEDHLQGATLFRYVVCSFVLDTQTLYNSL